MADRVRRTLHILFSFDNLAITIATVGVVALLYVIPQNVDFLNPVSQALGDFDITDMAFSKFRNEEEVDVDTNIVLVNIGMADRAEIAQIIQNLNWYEPAVIGVDAFFRQPKDPIGDSALAEAFAQTKELVLVSKVAYTEEAKEEDVERWAMSEADADRLFDTLEMSHPNFSWYADHGFANLIIDQEVSFMTCREIAMLEEWTGGVESSFPVVVTQHYDREAAQRALDRGVGEQTLNYHGNVSSFYHVDVWQALDPEFDLSFVEGKIVLLGFMGPNLETKSLEDAFFTPLNESYVGRSFPDMYGVVIHANAISMILRGNYIETMDDDMAIIIGFLVLIANVMMFTYMYEHYEDWYDMFAIGVQLAESLGILFLIVWVFDMYDYKLALTPALLSVFLVGTVHDLYQDSLKKVILGARERMKRRRKTATSDTSQRTDTGIVDREESA